MDGPRPRRSASRATSRAPAAYDRAVGARLKQARVAKGLTQGQAAAGAGISYQQWQKYEKGQSRIPVERLRAAAEAFGVGLGWLMEDRNGAGFSEDPAAYLSAPVREWDVRRLSGLLAAITDEQDRNAVQHVIERLAGRAA